MLALRFDSLMAGFSSEAVSFDYDEPSAFFFDSLDVRFDAAAVTFDAGVARANEALRFDGSITFDTNHDRFDEV